MLPNSIDSAARTTGQEVTPEQQTLFRQQGYLYIQGALRKELVQPVKTHVLNELKRLNIWSGGRTLSKRMKDLPAFQQVGNLGQLIRYPDLQHRLVTRELYFLMCQLTGVSLVSAQNAQLLLSLPHQAEWTLEGLNWHRDISRSRPAVNPGIQAFVLVDDVATHGGATLALAGSHRLGKEHRETPGMDKLIASAAGNRAAVDGIDLSVLEMAGRAGDVYLMDMRLLHTPSINATRNVRMMATVRYFANADVIESRK